MQKISNRDQFISEEIIPDKDSFNTEAMTTGEPGLPMRFTWRKQEYVVAEILDKWKDSGPCRNGSPEKYIRKHWFRIATTDGKEMQIYFDRQARNKSITKRWWLATVSRD